MSANTTKIELGEVQVEVIPRTVRAANTLGTLRYFLDLDPVPDGMPFDELIARGVFCALVAHTKSIANAPQGVLSAFSDAKLVYDKASATRAYIAFSDAIDVHVDLYNGWYAAVNVVRSPAGEVGLQPPTDENEPARKKKK